MNQCMSNRSCHASMLGRQLIERRNGGMVTQHYGNLPPLLAQRGLTLGTSLWRGHSGGQLAHEVHALAVRLPASEAGRDELSAFLVSGRYREEAAFHGDSYYFASFCADGLSKGAALSKDRKHCHLRSGPIPPMGESYAVTSDVSTPYAKDFLEVA